MKCGNGNLITVAFLLCLLIFPTNQIEAGFLDELGRIFNESQNRTNRISSLTGKWRFAVYGENKQLLCELQPRGDRAIAGYCHEGGSFEKVASLSVTERGSHYYFNLANVKSNRLVASGQFFPENESQLAGDCTLISNSGREQMRQCSLTRDFNESQNLRTGISVLTGKWRFAALGKEAQFICELEPRGNQAVMGYCNEEGYFEKIGKLSISERASSYYFNLVSLKSNRLVASGQFYIENAFHLAGDCTIILPDGQKQMLECYLTRE